MSISELFNLIEFSFTQNVPDFFYFRVPSGMKFNHH